MARIVVLCVAAVAAACYAALAGPPQAEEVLERFAFSKDAGAVLVPVDVKGKKYSFLLDTGASGTAYDSSLAVLLGKQVGTEEVSALGGGAVRLPRHAAPDAWLGRLKLPTAATVFVTDLRPFRESSGEDIYGILGMDFLRGQVFRIDPDRSEVVFLPSAGPNPGRRVAVAFDENAACVEAHMAGSGWSHWFLVDTGAAGFGSGDLREEVYGILDKGGNLQGAGTVLTDSLAGRTTRRQGRLTEMTVAGHRHTKLLFTESKTSVLGLGYWWRYVVTFDFPDKALYLKKARGYELPDAEDASGLSLLRRGDRIVVYRVSGGSAAARSGLRVNDVILEVDGRPAAEVRLGGLRQLLCQVGKTVRLVVSRGGARRDISLAL
jgi:hypothetical protein